MNKKCFIKKLEVGKEAETIFYNIMINEEDTALLLDVSDDKESRKKDIDFKYRSYSNIQDMVYIEVKNDTVMHKYGNFFIELSVENTTTKKKFTGWIQYTEADFIAYRDAENKIFYIIRLDDIKDYIEKYKPSIGYTYDNDKNTTQNRKVTGYKVPVNKFCKLYEVIKVSDNGIWY